MLQAEYYSQGRYTICSVEKNNKNNMLYIS